MLFNFPYTVLEGKLDLRRDSTYLNKTCAILTPSDPIDHVHQHALHCMCLSSVIWEMQPYDQFSTRFLEMHFC